METSTRDTALAHISLNVELQPIRQTAQNLIGLFALTLPNDYHGQRTRVLFEMFPHGRHKESEQSDDAQHISGATYDSVKQHETGDFLLVFLFLTSIFADKLSRFFMSNVQTSIRMLLN